MNNFLASLLLVNMLNKKYLGTITDGDIRKYLTKNFTSKNYNLTKKNIKQQNTAKH